MFKFSLAYRYLNGDVEGFVGTALSSAPQARNDAIRKLQNKLAGLHEQYYPERLITDPSGLTKNELDVIQDDWIVSDRSTLT